MKRFVPVLVMFALMLTSGLNTAHAQHTGGSFGGSNWGSGGSSSSAGTGSSGGSGGGGTSLLLFALTSGNSWCAASSVATTSIAGLPEVCQRFDLLSVELCQFAVRHHASRVRRISGAAGIATAVWGLLLPLRNAALQQVRVGAAAALPEVATNWAVAYGGWRIGTRVVLGVLGAGVALGAIFIDTAEYRNPLDPEIKVADMAQELVNQRAQARDPARTGVHPQEVERTLQNHCAVIQGDHSLQDRVNAWWNQTHHQQ